MGHEAIEVYSECLGVPLFRQVITGKPLNQSMVYQPSDPADEVEDLYQLLLKVKSEIPTAKAVSVGAILSNYQRIRVENV